MRFKTTREVLEFVRKFHQRASELFHNLEESSHSARIKMLLDYMSHHEAKLAQALKQFDDEETVAALNTWFDSAPVVQNISIDVGEIGDDLTIEQAVSLALQIDDYLIALYRTFAAHAPNDLVRDLFGDLVKGEVAEERILSRNAWMSQDM